MQADTDIELVHNCMTRYPEASPRTVAAYLGWIGPHSKPQDWRVIRALEALALDKRAVVRDGKWRLIS